MAARVGVSVRRVKAWEHDQACPSADEWKILAAILTFDEEFPKG